MTKSPAPWHGLTSAGLQADLCWIAPGMLPLSQIVGALGVGSSSPRPIEKAPHGSREGSYTAVVNSAVPGEGCRDRAGCSAPSTRCRGSPVGGGIGVQVSRDLCSLQEGEET